LRYITFIGNILEIQRLTNNKYCVGLIEQLTC